MGVLLLAVPSVPAYLPQEACTCPLIMFPIIDMPFESAGMYLMKLLPKSDWGHKDKLVIVQYATWHPVVKPSRDQGPLN